MATLKMSGCMKLVSKMSEGDQSALLDRLDQYQADGVPAERAQLMAAQDMLAEIQGERAQLFDLLKEQHPDLFTVEEGSDAAAVGDASARDEGLKFSRQRQAPDTPEFKRWFGDSQVVDANGEPLIVYHGSTAKGVTVFDTTRVTTRSVKGDIAGTYFTADQRVAGGFTRPPGATIRTPRGEVVAAYLKIENPLVTTATIKKYRKQGMSFGDAKRKALEALTPEHDGVIFEGDGVNPPEYVVFKPEQIKSATDNNGEYDPANPNITASRSRSPLGLYSALADNIDGIKTNAAPAQGWKDAIKGLVNKGQVKADEVEWSGVNDWLDLQQGKVTKDQVSEYLKQGGVKVIETVLADGAGQYAKYTLRGGENYREVLLRLPSKDDALRARIQELSRAMESLRKPGESTEDYEARQAEYERFYEERRELTSQYGLLDDAAYKSTHWDEKNVLAHIRVNDRTDVDGKRVLFVEELQSDWGQEGKKEGFGRTARKFTIRKDSSGIPELAGKWEVVENDQVIEEGFNSESAAKKWVDITSRAAPGIPSAPFVATRKFAVYLDGKEVMRTDKDGKEVKQRYESMEAAEAAAKKVGGEARDLGLQANTEGWLNLALKRVMTMAAEGGYDKVAFASGQQSAERYDLSKQVNAIAYSPKEQRLQAYDEYRREVIDEYNVPETKVEDYVGKEVAKRLLESPQVAGKHLLDGEDLKVGGEGMKAFYDTIVPTALKKLLPKVGGGQMARLTLANPAAGRFLVPTPLFDGTGTYGVFDSRSGGWLTEDDAGNETFTDDEEEATPYSQRAAVATARAYMEDASFKDGQIAFDVTDAMREKVASTGLPMFSPRRNMFGQQAPAATWLVPDDTYLDRNVIFQLQDKQIDMKRVVQAVKAATGGLADKWNAYLQEELYHGRAAKATKDFASSELKPLLQDMQSRGVSMADFEEFLHNRHAEERNKQIAKINPAMPDGGSGIDTADARAYLRGLTPEKRRAFDALAARVDAITAGTRQLLVSSGLETQDTINKWESAYGSYVPLMREDLDYGLPSGTGTGQGFSVRGSSSKRATGSSRPVVDVLANLVMQRERVITRAEKTRVGTALYGLAVQNPNTDFWLAVDPSSVKDPGKTVQDLINLGINPLDAQNIIEEPKQTYVDPRTGLVTQRVNPAMRSADNVLSVRINGEDKYVFFNANDERARRMSATLKNLDGQKLNMVLGASAVASRYFASINTQYNPIFGAINVMRDTQGALFNLSTTSIADKKADVLAGVAGAAKGIYQAVRATRKGRSYPPGSWAQLWDEFQNEGGQTGFRDMFKDSEDRAKGLESELKKISEGTLKGAGRAIFDWLSDYNETLENAVRLSAYKAAKGKGLSNEQAASVAKNLTVNFNRKGNVGAQAGALYAFFNASVQGTARLAETLKGPMGKKILYGGLLLGSAQALLLAAADFDDDEPPDFIKERNLVIPTGEGKYITVPMPLGLNVIPNTGRVVAEWALSGGKDTGKRVAQITGAMLDMFNPIGNAGWSLQTFLPTAIDPAAALAENKDWSGKPIAKKDMSGTDPSPGFTRAKDTASWIAKQLSYVLNLASGGTDYKSGDFSPTPDQIDYLLGQATGGVGREILKVSQAVESSVTGEELPTYKVPLVGRFYGDTKEQSAVANRYYANITELNAHEREIKGRREDRGDVAGYLRENPDARLVAFANNIERDVSKLRKRKRDMLEQGRSAESIKMIEMQISRRMAQLNDRIEQAQEAQ